MPLYEYRCNACGHLFEKIQKFSDPPVDVCPNCGERNVEKLLSSPAIQFKGTGWYITDYARKGATGDAAAKSEKSEKSENKTETKPASADSKGTSSSDSGASSSSSTSSSPSTTTPAPPSSKTS